MLFHRGRPRSRGMRVDRPGRHHRSKRGPRSAHGFTHPDHPPAGPTSGELSRDPGGTQPYLGCASAFLGLALAGPVSSSRTISAIRPLTSSLGAPAAVTISLIMSTRAHRSASVCGASWGRAATAAPSSMARMAHCSRATPLKCASVISGWAASSRCSTSKERASTRCAPLAI